MRSYWSVFVILVMGFDALIGVCFFSAAPGLEGPAGDMAGAAGVLIIGVCLALSILRGGLAGMTRRMIVL